MHPMSLKKSLPIAFVSMTLLLFLTPWALVAEEAIFCLYCGSKASSMRLPERGQVDEGDLLPALPMSAPALAVNTVTVTLRDSDIQDSYLDSDFSGENFATAGRLKMKFETKRPILKFNVEQYLPIGSQIVSAILQLRTTHDRYPAEPVRALKVEVYGLKRHWEGNAVTWNHATASVRWQTPGADDTVFDRDLVPVDSRTVDRINADYAFNVTALVQRWINDPTSNHGLLLIGREQSVEYRFYSTEELNTAFRPHLVITYNPSSAATPTPTQGVTPGITPVTTPTATRTPTIPQSEISKTFSPAADSFMDEYLPDNNYGSDWYLRLKYDTKRSLIRFDLETIPTSAQVTNATMWLYAYNRQGTAGPVELLAYRLRRPWVQSEVTWRRASSSQLWGQPGANDVIFDRDNSPAGRTTMNSVGVWYQVEVTQAVQWWVREPNTNFGFVLAGSMTSGEFLLYSNDYVVNPALRPRLEVRYFVPLPTPTPTHTATPTSTPTVTATPTITPTRTPTPTATPNTGSIAGMVWEDVNADGIPDPGEPPLADALIKLYNRYQQQIASHRTGADGRFRFDNLEANNPLDHTDYYTIIKTSPPGYVPTTDETFMVRVSANTTTTINFGDRPLITRTPTATPTGTLTPQATATVTATRTRTPTIVYRFSLHLPLVLREP